MRPAQGLCYRSCPPMTWRNWPGCCSPSACPLGKRGCANRILSWCLPRSIEQLDIRNYRAKLPLLSECFVTTGLSFRDRTFETGLLYLDLRLAPGWLHHLPRVNAEQVLRLNENKDFSYAEAQRDFGFSPLSSEFKSYIGSVEIIVEKKEMPASTEYCRFFTVEAKTFDKEHFNIEYYDPDSIKNEEWIRSEKWVSLSSAAEVFLPRSTRNPARNLYPKYFSYPLSGKRVFSSNRLVFSYWSHRNTLYLSEFLVR